MTNSDCYFSDRELGPKPKTEQKMNPTVWSGIVALVNSLVDKGAFGNEWPERCPEGQAICGNDVSTLERMIEAHFDGLLTWPLEISSSVLENQVTPGVPETRIALDLIEFVWRYVAKPSNIDYHKFYRYYLTSNVQEQAEFHHHLTFDVQAGQAEFRDNVNRILDRNGMAYELSEDGQIKRFASVILGETLARTSFQTDDSQLDAMLKESKEKFFNPDFKIRHEGLERLIDSWDRIKSLTDKDTLKSINNILDRCASPEAQPQFSELLGNEATKLTNIGNQYMLRHHGSKQSPVTDPDHVDYLYHRLFAMVELVIRKNPPPR